MLEKVKTYSGAIHIHTKCSDGSGRLHEIVTDAHSTALDFIIITDHNTLCYFDKGREGWYDNLLVLVGEEVTHRKGHCLAMNIRRSVAPKNGNPRIYLRDIKEQGGLSFIAHPHLAKNVVFRIKNCAWRDWSINSFTGMEIWSYMTDWVQHLKPSNFISHCSIPDRFISGPFKATLKQWDHLSQMRRVVAIGGIDAHARVILPFGLKKIFPYKDLFETVRTYVLAPPLPEDDFRTAKSMIYDALAQGHCFAANSRLRDPRGFSYICRLPDNRTLLQGDETMYEPGCRLECSLQSEARIRLLRNGKTVIDHVSREVSLCPHAPGVYRVEIFLDRTPWIFSNPIYLRPIPNNTGHSIKESYIQHTKDNGL